MNACHQMNNEMAVAQRKAHEMTAKTVVEDCWHATKTKCIVQKDMLGDVVAVRSCNSKIILCMRLAQQRCHVGPALALEIPWLNRLQGICHP